MEEAVIKGSVGHPPSHTIHSDHLTTCKCRIMRRNYATSAVMDADSRQMFQFLVFQIKLKVGAQNNR